MEFVKSAIIPLLWTLVIPLVLIVLFNKAFANQPTCENMKGQWHNQLQSTLTISKIDTKTGEISGTYRSPSGGGSEDYPLIGWVNNVQGRDWKGWNEVPVIAFSVRWGKIGSITSWTGYCEEIQGVSNMITLWHLVKPFTQYRWDHILTNSDIFTPGVGAQPTSPSKKHIVSSPMVGTFYRAPSPTSKSFVEEGQMVNKGDTLCIIKAMEILNQIVADKAGIVTKILVDDGAPVEYGEPLFIIE